MTDPKMSLQTDGEDEETRNIAIDIINAGDPHNLVTEFIKQFGCDKNVGLKRLIKLFSKSSNWREFSEPVRTWLEEKKNELHL
jgi:hypothetical protein